MTLTAIVVILATSTPGWAQAAEAAGDEGPAAHLPAHIRRLTHFGERPDWSHDGQKLLFLSKTFGDAMEIDLRTSAIRNLTAHFAHHGFVRAMYLANGDILLSGPAQYDPKRPDDARRNLAAAARALGLQRTYLHAKLASLGIARPRPSSE
jgi:hypothetical protein